MGRLRRVALWCGAALLGLAALGLLVVNLYVQSEGAQARIQQELSRRLQAPVTIRSTSVTPWGGLTLTGITIPQVSSSGSGAFLQARSFHVHVRLLPLLSRRLIIKEISLLGANVNWPQDPDGKWRLPGSHPSEERATASPAGKPTVAPAEPPSSGAPAISGSPIPRAEASRTASARAEAGGALFVPELRRINISDGNFRFFDRAGGFIAAFQGVKFHSSVREQALRGQVGASQISLRDKFFLQHFESGLRYDSHELSLLKIASRAANGLVNGDFTIQPQAANSPFSVRVRFRDVQADELVVEAGGPKGVIQGKLEGTIEAEGKGGDPAVLTGHGDLTLREGQLQQYSLLVALGQVLQIEELTQLQLQQAEAKYHVNAGTITVDELVLRSPNIRVSATGTVGFNGKLRLQSQLAINDKVRSQLFSPIKDNFQPISEAGLWAVDFQVNGSVDKPKTNLVERVVGRNLKDFVSGLFGGAKPDRSRRKRNENGSGSGADATTQPSAAPAGTAGVPPETSTPR